MAASAVTPARPNTSSVRVTVAAVGLVVLAVAVGMAVATGGSTSKTTEGTSVHATHGANVEELRLSGRGAGSSVANSVLDSVLHLSGDVLHGRGRDLDDGDLHSLRDHRVHGLGDVLDSALRNAGHRLLDHWVRAEDGQVGLRDDLEFHPGDLAEHHGQLLVRLDEDDDAALSAQARADIEARDVVFLAVGRVVAAGDEEEAVQVDVGARLAETMCIPDETTVDVTDAEVKVKAGV